MSLLASACEPAALRNLLGRLDEVLAGLAAVDLADAPPDQVAEAVLRVTRARRSLAGADARLVAALARCGVWELDGFRSPVAWLTARSTDGLGVVHGRARVATQASRHPVFAARLAAGEVSVRHLQVLADAHRRYPELAPALDGIEADLADYAVATSPEEFRRRLAEALHRIDPDAVDAADAARSRLEAGLHLTGLLDGWGKLDAVLPPDVHAQLLSLLDAGAAAGRREAEKGDGAGADADAGADPLGGSGPADPGTRRKRRLRAFVRVLAAAAAATGGQRLPDAGATRPVVTITIPVSGTLSPTGADTDADGDADPAARGPAPAWLHRTRTPLPRWAVRRLLCDATVRRLLVDPAGVPLDLGRSARTVTPGLRVAVEARDRWRCRFPGCRHPIDEVHHVTHWVDGGRTDLDGLAGLCGQHHTTLHARGWAVTGDANATLSFTSPTGRVWTSQSPGAVR